MSDPRLIDEEEARALAERVLDMATAPITYIYISCNVSGYSGFARNAMISAGDSASVFLRVTSFVDGQSGAADTNQFDDESLRRTVQRSEQFARSGLGEKTDGGALGPQEYVRPPLWYDGTLRVLDPKLRAQVSNDALKALSAAGVQGAGFVNAFVMSGAAFNNHGMAAYSRASNVSVSVSARTTDGTGSGSAGAEYNDWSRIDPQALVHRAVDLAKRSVNPVAVEPGKYTVVLEPGALADLMAPALRNSSMSLSSSEGGMTVYSKPEGGTKIGLRMLDPRISIVADPLHPTGPFQAFDIYGAPINRTVWFENGVLRNLAGSFVYPLGQGRQQLINTEAFQMTGGDTSVEEMIASTRLGFWVNRVSSLQTVDRQSLLQTGVTRDGLFLIENGEITRAVKNFRFNDSPFFILNNVEMLGEPERVAGRPARVVPRVKVRDFTFTSLSDAV